MKRDSFILALDRVSFVWAASGASRPALDNVSFAVRRGEWLAIVGTNGSGKSTLAKIIAGLLAPSAGTVAIRASEQPLVRMIFQNPDTQIIGETIEDEMWLALACAGLAPQEMRRRAWEALEQVGLAQLGDASVARLSGGQKQLLAIAGSLAAKPAAYIFDEATSMLDPAAKENIVRIARQLHREGKTIVWITQLLDELAWADRVIALQAGSVAFEGSPQRFFYEQPDGCGSHCERVGLLLPYAVRVARGLLSRGHKLAKLPLSPEELGKAVGEVR